MLYIVRYSGPFGFIKPWTAVRDIETFTQQFLTPSIIEGMEKKLYPELLSLETFPKRIARHRLTYSGISRQQEQTQPRGIKQKAKKIDTKTTSIEISRPRSILTRGVMINPILFLGFAKQEHAVTASSQHICLCRNEDVLLPDGEVVRLDETEFDKPDNGFNGFELRFGRNDQSFIVGYNRFHNNEPMYGWLQIVGDNPLQTNRADLV